MTRKILRKALIACVLLAVTMSAWAAGQSSPVFLVNPLGFLQFGPLFQLEFPITPNLSGVVHARLHGLGALSYLLYNTQPRIYSIAGGGGVRYFFNSPGATGAPYVGALVEVGYNPYTGGTETSNPFEGASLYMTVAANAGYRWRFNGGFTVEVGGYFGFAPTLSDQWHYVSTPTVTNQGKLTTTIFGMAEVSLGWEL